MTKKKRRRRRRREKRRKKGKGSLRFPTEVAISLPSPGKIRQIYSW